MNQPHRIAVIFLDEVSEETKRSYLIYKDIFYNTYALEDLSDDMNVEFSHTLIVDGEIKNTPDAVAFILQNLAAAITIIPIGKTVLVKNKYMRKVSIGKNKVISMS